MSEDLTRVIAVLGVVVVIVLARALFLNGGKMGPIAGMAVCRKCGRAFARPFLAPNMVVGKLVRCPHCGAWVILPAASQAELEVAAAREQGPEAPAAPSLGQEDELRQRIERSKYEQ